MIRKMIGFKREDAESMDDFMERSNGCIKNLIQMSGVMPWDLHSHHEVFQRAGVLSRTGIYAPHRLTSLVFKYKDWALISSIADSNNGRQRHGRYLRTWRWERPLYKSFGLDWQSLAQEKDSWNARATEFVFWRSRNRWSHFLIFPAVY